MFNKKYLFDVRFHANNEFQLNVEKINYLEKEMHLPR